MSGFCFNYEKGDPPPDDWFIIAGIWGIEDVSCIKSVPHALQPDVPPIVNFNVYKNVPDWLEGIKKPIYAVERSCVAAGRDLQDFAHPADCWYWFGPWGGHRKLPSYIAGVINVSQFHEKEVRADNIASILAYHRHTQIQKEFQTLIEG